MNAKQYVEYLGLADNYDSLSAADKISVIQNLLLHYEDDAGKSKLWPILKLVFKPFPDNKIPDFFLKSKYIGPFLYTVAHTTKFREQAISCLEKLIDEFNKNNEFSEERLNDIKEFEDYHILDCTYLKDDFNHKNRIFLTGYRKNDPAIKNNPTIKIFISILDSGNDWVILRNI